MKFIKEEEYESVFRITEKRKKKREHKVTNRIYLIMGFWYFI